ncbi:unnamed protein product, partial [Rotaria socialis]
AHLLFVFNISVYIWHFCCYKTASSIIILLVILFLFQFILACTYLTVRGQTKYNLLKRSYEEPIDDTQKTYDCRGSDNSTYFNRSVVCRKLGCCHSTSDCCETFSTCYTLLNNKLDKNLKIIGSIMLILN